MGTKFFRIVNFMKNEDESKKNEIQNISTSLIEVCVDVLLKDGLLKDIPFSSTILSFYKINSSIKDKMLINKIIAFLSNIDGVSKDDRVDAIERLETDEKYNRDVGVFLVEVLDRLDSHKKPAMLAKIFKSFVKKEISIDMFYRLSSVVERIALIDLPHIRPFHQGDSAYRASLDILVEQSLINAGLTKHAQTLSGPSYSPNIVCEMFIELDLDK